MKGYCVALPEPTRKWKWIPSLRYFVIKHHGSILLEGQCSSSKLHNTPTIPFISCPKNTLGSITWNMKGYCLWQGILNAHALPLYRVSHKYIGFQNISFETCKGIAWSYKETNIIIRVFSNQTPWVYTIGGVLFMLKTTQYTCITLYMLSHNTLGP
jgi:hypothetical protein